MGSADAASNNSSQPRQKRKKGLLMIVDATVANPDDHAINAKVHILLDGGAEGTFMDENLVHQLQLPQNQSTPLSIKPFLIGAQEIQSSDQVIHIQIHDKSWYFATTRWSSSLATRPQLD